MKKMNLGREGTIYVSSFLKKGSGLAAFLHTMVEHNGIVFAPLPNDFSDARARQFDVGGMGCRAEIYAWFVNYARQLPPGIMVFQDLWAKPDDLIARPPTHDDFFICGGGVYYFIQTKSLSEYLFEKIVKQIASFAWLGVYLRHDFGTYRLPRGVVQDAALIKKIAENTQMLATNAYDQDGLIVWQSSESFGEKLN